MNIKSIIFSFVCLFILLNTNLLQAQQTAIYQDAYRSFKRGMEFYQQRLFGKAEDELNKSIKQYTAVFPEQNTPTAFIDEAELFAAIAALRLGREDAEKRMLMLIQKHEPGALATKAKLEVGRYYYAKNDYKNAAAYLSKITWSDLSDMNNEEVIEAKFQLAYCYFLNKDFRKAGPLFRQTKGEKSDYYYPSHYYYGLCSFFQKNYREALKSFEVAQKSNKYKKYVPTYITQIYFMTGDYDKTIKYGEPYTNNPDIRDPLPIVQAVGQAHYEKGQFAKALPHIKRYVDNTKKTTEDVFYQLAYAQYRAGFYQEAEENFKEINSRDNDSKIGQNALYHQADCLLKMGKKKEARIAFESASKMAHDRDLQIDALMNYAKLSYELGLDNDAITGFMAILDNPKGEKYNNEAQNLMSKIFLNTRDYDKALSILRPIINGTNLKQKTKAIKQTYQKVCYFRGIQYYKENDFGNAIKLFNESLSLPVQDDISALSHYWKSEAFFNLNKYKLSIGEYIKFMDFIRLNKVTKLPANSSNATANYGIGYNYIRQGDYDNAAGYFSKSVKDIERNRRKINDSYVLNYVYPDALVKKGDCYLFLGETRKNYETAEIAYKKIIKNGYPNKDYAMYQLSLIYNLIDQNPNRQVRIVESLIKEFPNSPYADDAVYGKGSRLIDASDIDGAKKAFDLLILKYPNSEFNASALRKLGFISYSKGNRLEAMEYFKQVVNINLQTEDAKSAIEYIRKMYIEDGNPDGFIAYASTLQGFNISEMGADSLLYEAAVNSYESEAWAEAAVNFDKYLERFPNGINSIKAHLNRGICHYNLEDYKKSVLDFDKVSSASNPTAPAAMAEQANLLAGRVSYHITSDYSAGLNYYRRLLPLASNAEAQYEAKLYGLKCAIAINDLPAMTEMANLLLEDAGATSNNKAEAHYALAKVSHQQEKFEAARTAYEQAIKLAPDAAFSSESRYQIARTWYQDRKLQKGLDLAFQNNKHLGKHLDWLARNFILIADIYAEQGNLDAAKGTLENLLSNYTSNPDPDIVNEAKAKLKRVKEALSSNSRLRGNDDEGFKMLDDK